MKKYITLAALLAAGSLAANAATIDEANKLLQEALKDYTEGEAYNLTFTVGSAKTGGFEAILLLNRPDSYWGIKTQEGRYLGFGDASISGNYNNITDKEREELFSGEVKFNDTYWVFDNQITGGLTDAVVTLSYNAGATDTSLTITKGNEDWVEATITYAIELDRVVIGGYATGNLVGSVTVDGVTSAIPEPSAFGLLAGLGALALVGTRRRRK